jgi:hypothetical protein
MMVNTLAGQSIEAKRKWGKFAESISPKTCGTIASARQPAKLKLKGKGAQNSKVPRKK